MGRPKKKNVEVPAPAKLPEVSITLRVGATIYSSSGHTVAEALAKLERPAKAMVKSFLRVEANGHVFERMFFPNQLRLFLRPAASAMQAKMISNVL